MTHHPLVREIADSIISRVAANVICERCLDAVIMPEVIRNKARPTADVNQMFADLYRRLGPWEKHFARGLRTIWEKERRIVLANLRKLKKTCLEKSDMGEIIAQILYPAGGFRDEIADMAKALLIDEIAEFGPGFMSDLNVQAAFDVHNPRITKWLEKYAPKLSKNLEAVNLEDLRRELIAGIEAGEGIPDLAKRVNEIFDTYNQVRAEVIARTETLRGSNQAALEAYRQSGVVEYKIWIASEDACDICLELGSQNPVPVDEGWYDDDYGDGEAPPRHPNCRCAIGACFEET